MRLVRIEGISDSEVDSLGNRVRARAAGEDPHRAGLSVDLVPGGPFAEAGQLGDVRFFDPAPPVPVVQVAAGLIGVPLADLTLLIHRDLRDLDRDGRDRGLLLPRPKFTGGTLADFAPG